MAPPMMKRRCQPYAGMIARGQFGGDEASERNADDREGHREWTLPARHVFRCQRRRVRHRAAETDAREEPQYQERARSLDERDGDGENPERDHAGKECGAAAQTIAHHAAEKAANHHPEWT